MKIINASYPCITALGPIMNSICALLHPTDTVYANNGTLQINASGPFDAEQESRLNKIAGILEGEVIDPPSGAWT